MALSNERMTLDHATLMQIERTVEDVRRDVTELTREVDGMGDPPDVYCDCAMAQRGHCRPPDQTWTEALERIVKLEELIIKEHQARMR